MLRITCVHNGLVGTWCMDLHSKDDNIFAAYICFATHGVKQVRGAVAPRLACERAPAYEQRRLPIQQCSPLLAGM